MSETMQVLVPFVHVADVERSVAFYEQLGFTVGNTFRVEATGVLNWAWLQSAAAKLMLTRASGPIDPAAQAVLFYLYCPDVAAMRTPLLGRWVEVGEITTPFWAPRGEFRLHDPDGYVLMVTHT